MKQGQRAREVPRDLGRRRGERERERQREREREREIERERERERESKKKRERKKEKERKIERKKKINRRKHSSSPVLVLLMASLCITVQISDDLQLYQYSLTSIVQLENCNCIILAAVVVVRNACARNPCKNRGTCKNEGNNYSCICVAGYVGGNCQTGMYTYMH